MEDFLGLKIVTSEHCLDYEDIQVKKHKRKRINKKWIKRFGYKIISKPSSRVIIFNNTIICHPDMLNNFKDNSIDKEG
jgi:hypothetical protein